MILQDKIQTTISDRKYTKGKPMDKYGEAYWYLHNHKIFDQLTPEELKELSVLIGFLKVKKHQVVNLLRDDVKRIYFLKKGLLTISRHEGKKEITVDVINQGDVFGQIYSDKNFNSHKESIKVISDEAVICTFTKENFEKVLQNNPSLCLKYSKKVGDRLLSIQQRYSNLVFKDAKTRLLEFLIDYSRRNGNQNENNLVVKNMLTHQDIADLIGCQRQTISTLLKELKEENIIDYSRDEIIISNIK